jgi:hypothetical protein
MNICIQNNTPIDIQLINQYIRIHNEWIVLANHALQEIISLLSWPRWDFSTNPERPVWETKLLHSLYYAAASKAMVIYYKARMRGEDIYTRPPSPPLPPQMGGRQDFWQIQQPADDPAPANHLQVHQVLGQHPPFVGPHPPLDEPLVIQHETDNPLVVPQPVEQLPANPPNQLIPHHPPRPDANQVCTFYLENRCRYGNECRFSHSQDPTNVFIRRRRGGRRYTNKKNRENQGEGGVGGGGS